MKNATVLFYLLLISALFVSTKCTRDDEIVRRTSSTLTPPPPPPPPPPQSLWCSANVDITVELPTNYAILQGSGFGGVGNMLSYKWEKIDGPSSYSFENPDTFRTKVLNLNKGVYQFELTATDNSGNSVRDTMTLKVEDPTSSRHQVFFWDLTWQCPLSCGMAIENISSYISTNSLFDVYIKRDFSSNWELIVPYSSSASSRYYYELSPAGGIFIWEEPDVTIDDKPEIKIVF